MNLNTVYTLEPTVTIVTPSFNQCQYLESSIRSVLAQRNRIQQYLVLDGGSTDGSPAIIAKYSDQIDEWRSAPDGGQAQAIEEGFQKATGDILGWINSDDLLLPECIAHVQRHFQLNPDTQVVSGYFLQVDSLGQVKRCMWIPRDPAIWTRRGVTRICQPSTFFRRAFYEQVGGLDSRWECVMDTELWYRMLRQSGRWAVLPKYLAARRYHAATKGNQLVENYRQERKKLAGMYPEFFPCSLSRVAGRWWFRALQGVSVPFWRSVIDTLRFRATDVSVVVQQS